MTNAKRSAAWSTWASVAIVAIVVGLLGAHAVRAEPATAAAWTTAFQNEHNTQWSGGDQTNSIRTTGNNQIYFIHGDTYTMDEQMDNGGDGAGTYIRRSSNSVNNSIVRYIWYGADVVAPATATTEAVPSPAGTHLWGMDITEANNAVYALLADGTGGVFNHSGYLAKFQQNSDGTLTRSTGVAQIPAPSGSQPRIIHWNNSLINLSDTIYIYGSDDAGQTYVAKIAANAIDYGFLSAWNLMFFGNGTWNSDQNLAKPIAPHVFRSVRVVNGYLVATHRDDGTEVNGNFGVLRTSISDPQFQATVDEQCFKNAVTVPGQATSAGNVSKPKYTVRKMWTYCPTLHPELMPSNSSQVLVAIDWNVTDFWNDFWKDAELYKPRFFTISAPSQWPSTSKPCH